MIDDIRCIECSALVLPEIRYGREVYSLRCSEHRKVGLAAPEEQREPDGFGLVREALPQPRRRIDGPAPRSAMPAGAPVKMKRCSSCGVSKPRDPDHFTRKTGLRPNGQPRTGWRPECNECFRQDRLANT